MLGEQKQNTMSYIFGAGGHDAVANYRFVQILEQTVKQVTLDNFNPVWKELTYESRFPHSPKLDKVT